MGVTYKRRFDRCHGYGLDLSGEQDTVHTREEKGLKPVRVIMFANPFTWNNPILSYFKINGLLGPGIHKAGPGIVWELLEPFEEKKGGKMTADEFLGDAVYKNMGFMDQKAFIEPIPKGAIPMYQVRFGKNRYWMYQQKNRLYVKQSKKDNELLNCYGTMDGRMHFEKSIEDSQFYRILQKQCYNGNVMFVDINCKFDFLADLYGTR